MLVRSLFSKLDKNPLDFLSIYSNTCSFTTILRQLIPHLRQFSNWKKFIQIPSPMQIKKFDCFLPTTTTYNQFSGIWTDILIQISDTWIGSLRPNQ